MIFIENISKRIAHFFKLKYIEVTALQFVQSYKIEERTQFLNKKFVHTLFIKKNL